MLTYAFTHTPLHLYIYPYKIYSTSIRLLYASITFSLSYPNLHSTSFPISFLLYLFLHIFSSVLLPYLPQPYLPHVPLNLPLYYSIIPPISHSLPFSYFFHSSLLWYNDAKKSAIISLSCHSLVCPSFLIMVYHI